MDASQKIDEAIAKAQDWRGETAAEVRQMINEVDPSLTEVWKWNSPVWESNGLVCSIGIFKNHVKAVFFRGNELSDPHKLFNSGLDAKTMRSIDLAEGDTVDKAHFQELVREAVALNNKP